jgi:acyl-CoA thioester hydrolase
MNNFRFFHPIEVRYADLDPQGHVNNAKYVTYFETARVHYKQHIGTFETGQSFLDIGVILADLQITFLAPILWGTPIKVGARVTKLGSKSIQMEQCIVSADEKTVFATGKVVMVAFDYRAGKSVLIPEDWRNKMSEFEGLA